MKQAIVPSPASGRHLLPTRQQSKLVARPRNHITHETRTHRPAQHQRGAVRVQGPGAADAARAATAIVVDIADDGCPCCSTPPWRVGEDVSERLDGVPAQFRLPVGRRPKCAGPGLSGRRGPAPRAGAVDRGQAVALLPWASPTVPGLKATAWAGPDPGVPPPCLTAYRRAAWALDDADDDPIRSGRPTPARRSGGRHRRLGRLAAAASASRTRRCARTVRRAAWH